MGFKFQRATRFVFLSVMGFCPVPAAGSAALEAMEFKIHLAVPSVKSLSQAIGTGGVFLTQGQGRGVKANLRT